MKSGFWFVAPFLALYIAFLVVPLVLGFEASFTDQSITGHGSFVGTANYVELFSDPAVWSSLWHTLVFTAASTPVIVLVGLVMALLTNRAVPERWLYRLAFFAPYLLPVSVVATIWNWLYQPRFGLLDSMLGNIGWLSTNTMAMVSIIITTLWWTAGFGYLLYLAALQDIPLQLYEASALDGASPGQQLRQITLPLLTRTHQLVIMLQVLASLKVFDQIYLLTGQGGMPGVRSIVQYIYESGFTRFRIGYASAISYMFFVLIAVVALVHIRLRADRK